MSLPDQKMHRIWASPGALGGGAAYIRSLSGIHQSVVAPFIWEQLSETAPPQPWKTWRSLGFRAVVLS